jgi:transcriptional regulator with XRE-family HTH domain
MKPDASSPTARDILRQVRRRQRLTQAQLAARAGVNQTVVARYESGQQPTLPALERLVAASGYELTWSLRSAGDPSTTTHAATTRASTGIWRTAARVPGRASPSV